MKNILVPVDFSEMSEQARKVAVEIANKTGAELHFLHVNESVAVAKENSVNVSEDNIEEKLKSFASFAQNHNTKTFLTDGVPYDDIVNHSEEYNSGLIILYSDGGAYHSTYTATNVLRVTRLANCPVLVIPSNLKSFKINKVVFVSDFTYEHDYREQVENVFEKLLDFVKPFDPEMELLYVKFDGHPEEKLQKCMEDFAEKYEGKNLKLNIVESKTVENGALGFAKESKADMICLIGHGSGNYYTQLRTSISEKLLEKTDVPVLVIRVSN